VTEGQTARERPIGGGTLENAAGSNLLHQYRVAEPQVLPVEWRSWIAENRLQGTSDEQISEVLIDSGYSAELVRAEMDAQRSDPCYLVAQRMAQRYMKLKSVLDTSASVRGLSFGSRSVERRTAVSRAEFLERYYAASRPIVLTGMLAGSPARARWTPKYFSEICGDATVQIMAGRHADPRYELNSESHRRELKLSTYVSMVLEGGLSNDYYLVANNNFFEREEFECLYNEVPRLTAYLDHTDAKQKVFLWFGPAGTITPLHHDVMNVLVAQIYGRKRVTLISPEHTPYVYNEIGCYSEVDCANPNLEQHPLYSQAKPLNVVLRPGDVLFIPVGWWHYVEALDTSIMVSYINFVFLNQYEWFHPGPR
jgi:hypothetical protein